MLPEIQSDPDYKNTRTPHQTHGKVKQFKKLCIMPTRINQIMLKQKWVLGDLLRVAGGLTRSRRITPEKEEEKERGSAAREWMWERIYVGISSTVCNC